MSAADGNDTRPGFRRRSSHPPARRDSEDLPEPLMPSATETVRDYVRELHGDVRSLRTEMVNRQEAARGAINNLQHDFVRIEAALNGLKTSQGILFQELRADRKRERWVSIVGVTMLSVLLVVFVLRIFGMVGV